MRQNTTSIERAKQLITEFLESGQSKKEFCQAHNININTFHWWLKRQNALENKKTSSGPSNEIKPFVQLTPKKQTAAVMSKESELTIEFENGTRLKWRGIDIPMSFYELVTSLQTGISR